MNGPAYLVVRVLHQSSRGIEGCGTRHLNLNIGTKPSQIKAQNPARLDSKTWPPLKVVTPRPPKSPLRFVVPSSLVKLGRRLRFIGFDTALVDSISEASVTAESEKRKMILLEGSRTGALGTVCTVPRSSLEIQLQHILDHFGILLDPALMASRCAECNADKFRLASAWEAASELHASTVERYSEFWRCCNCRKLYWEGGAWCRSMRALGSTPLGPDTGKRA
ncbi:Uncharacterized protein SCF082_LOCUS40663, partial [Durusdinium trenchii]